MITPILKRYLGRNQDHVDARDRLLKVSSVLGLDAPLVPYADVLKGMRLPVFDQGALGSCTANVGAIYRAWLNEKFERVPAPELSRLFLYYQERALPWNNDVQKDDGAEIRDIFVVLAKTGICPEDVDPYVPEKFAEFPGDDVVAKAATWKIGAYHRVVDLASIRSCIASGYPVAIGFPVYESFERIGSDGKMPMPKKTEAVLGGHAVFCHGYSDDRRALLIQNSWGPDWGAGGHFWMPYEYVGEYGAAMDFWMGHLGAPWKPKK